VIGSKDQLRWWVVDALRELGGSAALVDICRWVWDHKRQALKDSGDLFYTWQYDIRWAATQLRTEGRLRPASVSPRGVWELADD
jgi:hypothetical protein